MPFVVGQPFGGPEELDADVRHHQIDSLKTVEDLLRSSLDCLAAGNINGQAEGGDTVRLRQRSSFGVGALRVSVEQRHTMPRWAQCAAIASPNPEAPPVMTATSPTRPAVAIGVPLSDNSDLDIKSDTVWNRS